ncbi:MAG: T9SS type A sorting domain-containing protein [Bacteroidia bacterium]|nr:T9SS type A sorting domain-containing protein [Bacteroidia bacterium]
MKKIYLFLLALSFVSVSKAAFYVIVPSAGGAAYTPSIVNVVVGDVVQWGNSTTYPCAQVSQSTWQANGTATVAGGFGTKTASYQMTVTATTGTIYFVCTTKVATNGTKGIVTLNGTVGLTTNQIYLSNLLVFPNPAKGEVNLTVPAGIETINAKLFALNGQEVEVLNAAQSATPNTFVLTFSPMITKGIYFLEISSGTEKIYRRIAIAD